MEPESGATRASGTAGPGLDPVLERHFARPLLDQLHRLSAQAGSAGGRPPVLALNGPVGAGKSSLGRHLEALAPSWGLRLVVASIDDLYLTWPQRRQRLAGNPFGVSRVPPGSHDVPLLLRCLRDWRRGGELRLPQFDKTLAGGEGDRSGWRVQPCDALVLEGWLMGCRPLALERFAPDRLSPDGLHSDGLHSQGLPRNGFPLDSPSPDSRAPAGDEDPRNPAGVIPAGVIRARGAPVLHPAERDWLPRWNRELAAYQPLWEACDGLWVLRPQHWGLPRRWRLQAEARQRRAGGGWLPAAALEGLVRSSLCSLPPALYQDPLVRHWSAQGLVQTWPPLTPPEPFHPGARHPGPRQPEHQQPGAQQPVLASPQTARQDREPPAEIGTAGADAASTMVQPEVKSLSLQGVALLDGRRRCRLALLHKDWAELQGASDGLRSLN